MKIIIFVVLTVPFVFGIKKPTCEEYIENSPQCVQCSADGRKIYLYGDDQKNYVDAETFCVQNHGHLFQPRNVEQLGAILGSFPKHTDGTSVLTGFIDIIAADAVGTAISPCGITQDTSNGMTEISLDSTEDDKCIVGTAADGSSEAANCNDPFDFICEIDYFEGSKFFIPSNVATQVTLDPTPGNGALAELIGDNQETFAAAKERCQGNKFGTTGTTDPPIDKIGDDVGNLVTIDSFQKNGFLSDLLKSRSLIGDSNKLWTGLSYDQNCGKYSWCDNSKTFYRKWCTNHPKLDISNTTVLPPLDTNFVQYCVANGDSDTKGCLQTYEVPEDMGNPVDEEEQKLLYICEKKSKCDDDLKDFMKVIGQQVGFLRRQCRSCNAIKG